MSPSAVILTVLGYVAVLVVVAWFSGRRADNAGFFTGNRRTPWYMAALAMIGAAMSGVTFISVPGSVAADSFSYMQMVAGFTVGQLIVAFVLVPLFYRLGVVSLYQYLDERFGIVSHRAGACFFFVSKMLGAALRVYVVCAVMQLLVFDRYGLPFWLNAALTVALVWLYTRQGGVRSLIWTDTLKTLCLVGSLVLTILFVARSLGLSGSGDLVREVAASPMSRIFFFDDPASDRYFWKMFVAGIVILVAMTGLDQDMMQCNLSCRSPRDARRNIVLTALCQIVVILLFLVLGVLLYIYAERAGLALPPKSDQLFSLVAVDGGLPTAVGAVFVLGLVSSTYSSAGSALTALTTSFTVDLLDGPRRYDERRLTRVRRLVHAAMAVCMTLVILGVGYLADDNAINLFFRIVSYTYGPILGMFLFGMLSRRRPRDRWVPLAALAGPVLSALLQHLAAERWGYRIGFELLVYNALFVIAGLALLSVGRKNEHRIE
ncbi:MAG: sodium:solute symporter [Alistipes sp.]|nr:sodium:solute symporter [Alistipes senegalensis]MCM1250336.1 sodium:solute symporter [Alistipes sp.]